jgi:hypothetical protein
MTINPDCRYLTLLCDNLKKNVLQIFLSDTILSQNFSTECSKEQKNKRTMALEIPLEAKVGVFLV